MPTNTRQAERSSTGFARITAYRITRGNTNQSRRGTTERGERIMDNKEEPMAPDLYYNNVVKCKRCSKTLDIIEHHYCPQCGQKIDWTKLPDDWERRVLRDA